LGISRQLVTLALAGYPQVSAKSRKSIMAAARKMGYRPNPHALALGRKRTGIIALWIPDYISNHYIHVAREINRMVKEARNELIISEVGSAEAKQIFSHVPIDGILAVDASEQVDAYRKISSSRSIPVVSMGAHRPHKGDFVQVDLHAGTLEVMDHLIGSGYRRIAHATFVRKSEGSRRLGYIQAMQKAGLEPEFIYYPLDEQQRPVARQLIQDYIREHGCPDAIFCHSDDAALGMYRGLCDLKLRVPQDVALVGCDGIDDTEYLECPLTTLMQPVAEACANAWQFLLKRMDNPTTKSQHVVLKPRLVIRQSSLR
jgi:LacI family transcriptional regulator